MRVLLDECIHERLRHLFTGHDCQTCRYAGLKGLSNGRLLAAAEQAGFDVVITVDQHLQFQQNLRDRGIALVVLKAPTTDYDDLLLLIPEVLHAIDTLKPAQRVRIGIQ